jgi:hypothetical protein
MNLIFFNKMPNHRLTLEYAINFIREKTGDKLLATEYESDRTKMDIECHGCGVIYKQNIHRIRSGYAHCKPDDDRYRGPHGRLVKTPKPKNIPEKIKSKIKPTKICITCGNGYVGKRTKQKNCSKKCANVAWKTKEKREAAKINGSKGGKISASIQTRRSKNEIYFSKLCMDYFGNENIKTNEPIFDNWDADVIIINLKIAVLWNGIWHYQKVNEKHSVVQVQSRDKIKEGVIEKNGYRFFVIKDMGKYNKKFVEFQFQAFLFMIIGL